MGKGWNTHSKFVEKSCFWLITFQWHTNPQLLNFWWWQWDAHFLQFSCRADVIEGIKNTRKRIFGHFELADSVKNPGMNTSDGWNRMKLGAPYRTKDALSNHIKIVVIWYCFPYQLVFNLEINVWLVPFDGASFVL